MYKRGTSPSLVSLRDPKAFPVNDGGLAGDSHGRHLACCMYTHANKKRDIPWKRENPARTRSDVSRERNSRREKDSLREVLQQNFALYVCARRLILIRVDIKTKTSLSLVILTIIALRNFKARNKEKYIAENYFLKSSIFMY